MRKNHIQVLRLMIWHTTDLGTNVWGEIPSVGGAISGKYRANLINFLTDVKSAGVRQLIISFGPVASNDPMENYGNPNAVPYDPAKFNENWSFIQDVRSLVMQYGPFDVWFDLHNEGVPYDYLNSRVYQQVKAYDTQMYTNYVTKYGNRDVTISLMGSFDDQKIAKDQVQALTDIFTASGKGMPSVIDVHVYERTGGEASVFQDLSTIDDELRANNLRQPLLISETSYNNVNVAKGVRDFVASSTRKIESVVEWPLVYGSSCGFGPNPPFTVDSYYTTFYAESSGSAVRPSWVIQQRPPVNK